jgi:hypothetical protein
MRVSRRGVYDMLPDANYGEEGRAFFKEQFFQK